MRLRIKERKGAVNRLASSLAEAVARLPSKRRLRHQWSSKGQVPFLLGCRGTLDAKGDQNFCGHLRAPWNTRRISTTLLRTR
jgi:hypothetical protein